MITRGRGGERGGLWRRGAGDGEKCVAGRGCGGYRYLLSLYGTRDCRWDLGGVRGFFFSETGGLRKLWLLTFFPTVVSLFSPSSSLLSLHSIIRTFSSVIYIRFRILAIHIHFFPNISPSFDI